MFPIENKVNSLHYLLSFETTICPLEKLAACTWMPASIKFLFLKCYSSCTVNEVTHTDTNTQPDTPKVISYELRHYAWEYSPTLEHFNDPGNRMLDWLSGMFMQMYKCKHPVTISFQTATCRNPSFAPSPNCEIWESQVEPRGLWEAAKYLMSCSHIIKIWLT